jgi:uncharacterized YceG family protein
MQRQFPNRTYSGVPKSRQQGNAKDWSRKIGRRLIIGVWLWWLANISVLSGNFSFPETITIPEWWWYSTIKNELSWFDSARFSWKLKAEKEHLPVILPWTYHLGEAKSRQDLIDMLAAWPTREYVTVTLLEWWSSYDIDQWLARKYINPGQYRTFITNQEIIQRYQQRYPFLKAEFLWVQLTSLEWFLYPDTYNLDADKDIIDQLVYLQLENRKKRIRDPYEKEWTNLQNWLRQQGYTFSINPYEALILSSIVDKEEPNPENKALVTSIFFNRLEKKMRIDADISLCYGLGQPYTACSPQVIVRNLKDTTNRWNTRARQWLPPTPISNPEITTIAWFFDAQPTEHLFYLHDTRWRLHPSVTLDEHNKKVAQYLR